MMMMTMTVMTVDGDDDDGDDGTCYAETCLIGSQMQCLISMSDCCRCCIGAMTKQQRNDATKASAGSLQHMMILMLILMI